MCWKQVVDYLRYQITSVAAAEATEEEKTISSKNQDKITSKILQPF